MNTIETGLDLFLQSPPDWLTGLRLGLLSNPASVNSRFVHARQLIELRLPGQLRALFSPQHGFFSEKQDNMIESDDRVDPMLALPVYSLYGKTRRPTQRMFDQIDVLLVDLQDVGTRVYTFIYTLSYCLEAAKAFGKKVIVFDRPNPINGLTIEGNLLSNDSRSFVGKFAIPMRHGLTIAEIARLFNEHFRIGADLSVIPMVGWRRSMYFHETGLPWIAPSPNLPTPAASMVYPGQVIWEGTNVSEGRGTTQPFEIFGAPFIDPEAILSKIPATFLSGVHFRPMGFEPTANKWRQAFCNGFQIHVVNPKTYQPYITSLHFLKAIRDCYTEQFAWKSPPYEYEYDRLPIDLILGDTAIREHIEQGESIRDLAASWEKDLKAFEQMRQQFFLY
ncbi:MAG: DUF1343 domain-containing protein [Deltaproteobacteria bacterium]|nr:DUF1343 domain-containing protein [Deltaproteobacteria bacterium]